jgi:hypothetical protein
MATGETGFADVRFDLISLQYHHSLAELGGIDNTRPKE